MTKVIRSSKELVDFINLLPDLEKEKDTINTLHQSLNKADKLKYDTNFINNIRDQMFDNLEKILNIFFSKDSEVEIFKKSHNIERIIISVIEENNTLYATI